MQTLDPFPDLIEKVNAFIPYTLDLHKRGLEIVAVDDEDYILKLKDVDDCYTRTKADGYKIDQLECLRQTTEHLLSLLPPTVAAFQATASGMTSNGLPDDIDPNDPPRNYAEAMRRKDSKEWQEAFDKEAQGFIQRKSFTQKRPPPGAKIIGTTTTLEYKMDNGEFIKRKARLCIRGDQQKKDEHYQASDLYSPVIKATEIRLLIAIAAQSGLPIYKTDTKQAFLYGDLDEEIYIRPPDWWPEPIEPGNALLLENSIYGLKQAGRRWHIRVSDWMIANDYLPVNEEMTIFKKQVGSDFILHGVYVDDIKSVPSAPWLLKEFDEKYS
jgi:hypothetical protein